ncbi:MAG: hypothetical protein ABSA49_01270 [Rhizomicrobium sp.]
MRIAYFVHDLNDAAVAKRLLMLKTAGLETVAAGFWRGAKPPLEIAGARTVPLGRTYDARLAHRSFAAACQALISRGVMRKVGPAHLFLARNLEMLAIAVAAKRHFRVPPAVVYEVLDIHRSLLSSSLTGKALRLLERVLMDRSDFLLTSSPAFLRAYFESPQFPDRRLPAAVIENKFLQLQPRDRTDEDAQLAPGPPWRIGWFGMIRCARSLDILRDLARRRPDLIQVEIRGRPAQSVFGNFEDRVRDVPSLSFGGPYAPADTQWLYGSVHFNWAIDYFEEGANSEWLLPNRIYEGGSCNAVPIALRRTETGRWLKSLDLGVLLQDPVSDLETFLEKLTPAGFEALKSAARHAPRSVFIADQSDCDRMATILEKLVKRPQRVPLNDRAGQSARC